VIRVFDGGRAEVVKEFACSWRVDREGRGGCIAFVGDKEGVGGCCYFFCGSHCVTGSIGDFGTNAIIFGCYRRHREVICLALEILNYFKSTETMGETKIKT
jgi:hypothetical protein